MLRECDFDGVYFKSAEWHASAKIRNKKCYIGAYKTARAAAVARDMELLRCCGEEAAADLNFEYEIVNSTSTELTVLDGFGTTISISLATDQDWSPIEPPSSKDTHREVMTASIILPKTWPLLSCNYMPWAERTQMASAVAAAFSYEIKFPFQSSLGLNLKPHSMMYSQAGGKSFVGCLTVVDVTPSLATVIRPGDILLRVNDTDLVLPGHKFDFEGATRAITTATTPRVLRLMRPYCPSILPSPAEMFSLTRVHPPIAKFHVVANTTNPQERSLQLTSVDSQVLVYFYDKIVLCCIYDAISSDSSCHQTAAARSRPALQSVCDASAHSETT